MTNNQSKFIGEVVARVGEYQKDGQTKGRYIKCGALFHNEDKGSYSIKLDAVPTNTEWLNVYLKEEEKEEEKKENNKEPEQEEDLPF